MPEIRMPSLGADMDAGTLVEWKVAVGDRVARGDDRRAGRDPEGDDGDRELRRRRRRGAPRRAGHQGRRSAPCSRGCAPRATAAAPAPAVATRRARARGSGRRARGVAGPRPQLARGAEARARARHRSRARSTAPARTARSSCATSTPPPATPPAPAAPRPPPPPPSPRRPVPAASPMRDAIAAAMSRSKREIPHYYLAHTISLKRALALARGDQRAPADPGAHPPRRAAPARGRARAVGGPRAQRLLDRRRVPAVRGGPPRRRRSRCAPAALIAPAILDADDKPLDQLMRELHDLVARARAGRLRERELTSATITVTSLGDRGCEAVFPVINPPQVAIVGFGAVLERPWVEGAAVVPHPTVVGDARGRSPRLRRPPRRAVPRRARSRAPGARQAMTDLADQILATLHRIAPDVDPAAVDRARPLADQLDLDSMDYQNLLASLSTEHAIPIPEQRRPAPALDRRPRAIHRDPRRPRAGRSVKASRAGR